MESEIEQRRRNGKEKGITNTAMMEKCWWVDASRCDPTVISSKHLLLYFEKNLEFW